VSLLKHGERRLISIPTDARRFRLIDIVGLLNNLLARTTRRSSYYGEVSMRITSRRIQAISSISQALQMVNGGRRGSTQPDCPSPQGTTHNAKVTLLVLREVSWKTCASNKIRKAGKKWQQ
jgi:hypothetical protein